ncbi:hypothetical protein Aph02nite_30280 [Actinoplanes philippinensis]|uniref:hypothetical protein n=1 Tax=Actinoplanes philippinensis TaxID=35752 RepID=UPI0011604810|nr:hypothetical protein [Actinoplanes philippinensis]GIE77078.1 hypothetical protein Aph02nite_30280 [Actinoplanes philippinensis]
MTDSNGAVVEVAAGEYLAGRPDRAGRLVQEHSGGEGAVDLTQIALLAAGQILQTVHGLAGDRLVDALLTSIGTVDAPRPDLRAVVVETARRYAEPGVALLCRRAAHRMITAAGNTALDAPLDAILALAALVMQFDNRDDLLTLGCGRADRLVAVSETPFRLVWAQMTGDADAQREHLRVLTETGDPADLLVWYFGLAHGVSGRTDAGGENPALDAIAGDVADGRLGDALDVARGFASRLSPTLVISTAAVHLTREILAVAARDGTAAGTVLDDLWSRATT